MSTIHKIYIQKYHEQKIAEFGSETAESLGWFTTETQHKRFDVLAQIGNLNNCTILDIGCGNADLCSYLNQKFEQIQYHGIDLISLFLDNAIEKNKDFPNTRFYVGDFMDADLPAADYILLSGALNYKNTDPDYIFKAIAKLYHHSKIGLAFNLLSEALSPDSIIVSYPPAIIKAFCETLSPKVVLKNDYDDSDFTLFVYK
jgi:SAM-dependent methyltransferase